MGGVLLFLWRNHKRCGWLNAALKSQQSTNAEEEEEEGELEDEEDFLH